MATISGLTKLVWTGTSGTDPNNCEGITLQNYKDSISRVYTVAQSGRRFVFQRPSESDSLFAEIKNFECGGAYLLFISADAINIPSATPSHLSKNNGLVKLNIPYKIRIQNLTGSYAQANGTYELTTYFQNDAPTYKKENTEWVIKKQNDSNWYLGNSFTSLEFLKNTTGYPTTGAFESENCPGDDCQRGFATELGSPTDTTAPNAPTILSSPPPLTNLEELQFTWNSDPDVALYKIEFNQNDQLIVSSSTAHFSSVSTEGTNIFRISASDQFGNESPFVEVRVEVDLTQPDAPIINAPISPISTNKLSFTWVGDETTVKYVYKFNSSEWVEIQATEDLSFTGDSIQGENTFEVRAFDAAGNVSETAKANINVIDPGLPIPTIQPMSTPTSSPTLVFHWTILGSFSSYHYRFNTSVWTALSAGNNQYDGISQQGLNFFEIRTVDSDGNKSDIARIEIFVDSLPPAPPVIAPQSTTSDIFELSFSWSGDNDVVSYIYNFNNSVWKTLPFNITQLDILGVEGDNKFKIKAADDLGNESEPAEQVVIVNTSTLSAPMLTSPTSPTNSTTLQYSWSLVQGAVEYNCRFNNGTWFLSSLTNRSFVTNGIQGENLFEVRAVDSLGRTSPTTSSVVLVDSIAPDTPVLLDTMSPTSDTTLRFSWISVADAIKYKINFNNTGWQDVATPATFISLPALQGNNIFKIIAVDIAGNESDENTKSVFVDSIPPSTPNLQNPTIRVSDGKTLLKYIWTYSATDIVSIEYKFNSSDWVNISTTNQIEVEAVEGTNTFQVRLLDGVGNTSPVATKQTVVDFVAPVLPSIVSPYGICPENLWQDLWTACQRSLVGLTTDVTITYSFMRSGTVIASDVEIELLDNTTRNLELPTIPVSDFISEIELAFQHWKELIQTAFPNVNVTFEQLGFEEHTETKYPSTTNVIYESSVSNTIGDIRIGVYEIYNEGVLGHAVKPKSIDNPLCNPTQTRYKSGAGDLNIDYGQSWRRDIESSNSAVSLMYVLVHELGHSLGLEHISSPESVMSPTGSDLDSMHTNFPGGLKNSQVDLDLFYKTYSYPSQSDKVIRVLPHENSINIDFSASASSLFEWKYNLVNHSTNELVLAGSWTQYAETYSEGGTINIDVAHDYSNFDIEFKVRSFDQHQNKSEVADVRIKLVDYPTNANILSVTEVCDNSEYKHLSNCWDFLGNFTAELVYSSAKTSNQEMILSRNKTSDDDWSYLPQITTDTISRMSTRGLETNTEYEFSAGVRDNGIDLRIASEEIHSSRVGVLFSQFSPKLKLTTSVSDVENPNPVQLATPEHFRYITVNGFTYPLGESYDANYIWKPTCTLRWSLSVDVDFDTYMLVWSEYSDFGNFADDKAFAVYLSGGQSLQSTSLRLQKYNTKYYIGIAVKDTSGNISELSTIEYTTVPYDAPPQIAGDVEVTYHNFFGEDRYNELPGIKWNLKFSLPWANDTQYGTDHNVPDTDVTWMNNTYSDEEWMTNLGHLPYRFECTDWPHIEGDDGAVGFFFSKTGDSDGILSIEVNPTNNKMEFSLTGWEADTEYRFKFFMYDITGHFTTYDFSFMTNSKPSDVTAPSIPFNLYATPNVYYNGKDVNGNSLANVQWIYDFTWSAKDESDLDKFLVFLQEDGSSIIGMASLSLTEVNPTLGLNGDIIASYRLSGVKPNTQYKFTIASVDVQGNRSFESNDYIFVTPDGDTTKPATLQNVNAEKTSPSSFSVYFNSPGNVDTNAVLLRYTSSSSSDFWNWEGSLFASSSATTEGSLVSLSATGLQLNGVYQYCLHSVDFAFNWSDPIMGTINLAASLKTDDVEIKKIIYCPVK